MPRAVVLGDGDMKIHLHVKCGGVAERVSQDWDWEREFGLATILKILEWFTELREAGKVTIEDLPEISDYRERRVTIDLGDT